MGDGPILRGADAARTPLVTGDCLGVDAGRAGSFFVDRSDDFDVTTGAAGFLTVGVAGFLLTGVADLVGLEATNLAGSFAAGCGDERPPGTGE